MHQFFMPKFLSVVYEIEKYRPEEARHSLERVLQKRRHSVEQISEGEHDSEGTGHLPQPSGEGGPWVPNAGGQR